MPPPNTSVPALVADLKDAFPRTKVPDATFRIYVAALVDLPPAPLEAAVRELIRTAEFFPTVAEIRAGAAERILALPTEDEALAQVEARMDWARQDRAERAETPPAVHPAVIEALDLAGGYHALRAGDAPSIVRAQFVKYYRGIRGRRIREVQVDGGPALPAAPDRLELTA